VLARNRRGAAMLAAAARAERPASSPCLISLRITASAGRGRRARRTSRIAGAGAVILAGAGRRDVVAGYKGPLPKGPLPPSFQNARPPAASKPAAVLTMGNAAADTVLRPS
jgi:hypothetical protein